jgi:Acetylornithine deacetylase/Succinyl-diaminopimelate desuccinylase and related deacylases
VRVAIMNSGLEKLATGYVETHREDMFSLLSKLVQFDTQNLVTYGREKECQNYIAGLYRDMGLETDVYSPDSIPGIKEHPGYLAGRGMEDRPNVTGICYGYNISDRVMIAAHTDTMPVGDPAKWTVDPFGGIVRDGRIYGLGVGDNKFGIAGGYFALKALKECGIKLKKTVLLTAYTDEEYGGGDGALGACLKYPCGTYVNLDGGKYEMWVSALGGGGFEIEVKTDYTSITSTPIVNTLIGIKSEVEAMGSRRHEELHKNRLYTGSDMERSAYRLVQFSSGNFGSNLDSGKLSFVIYTDKPRERIHAELDEIMKKIKPGLNQARLSTQGFKPTTRFFDYVEADPKDLAVEIMTKAAEDASGRKVRQCGACLSDLSVFLSYGSRSSFNFGIFRDFSQDGGAHQPDEFIECKQFLEHTKALVLFLIRFCGTVD